MAQKLNLIIDQGASFSTTFTVNDDGGNPINFTGYTGYSQIRKHYTSSNSVSFNVSLGNDGTVGLTLTSNVTNTMVPGRYVYDVEVVTGIITSRIVEGIVTVTPQVTRL